YLGYLISFILLGEPNGFHLLFSGSIAAQTIIISLVMSMLLNLFFYANARQARIAMEMAAQQQRALDAEHRALEAQLRMLQAQIEPHFLYNTLANAVGLIDPAPTRARQLLEHLIDYLRASLVSSREETTYLGREIETIRAYLDLMQVRMGERLRYRIDLPAALRGQPLPPMLLQPLVENAITHGLEPKIEGGEITLTVETATDGLLITIADTGVGLNPNAVPRPGGGIGLTNLRERLAVLYGGSASISLLENAPCGVKVVLKLPLQLGNAPYPLTTQGSPHA
ncbi:MAG: histidine kinase, partial [Burkholderiales bacterium]|nr:histidine kinase [Burkholderiales bacterium]